MPLPENYTEPVNECIQQLQLLTVFGNTYYRSYFQIAFIQQKIFIVSMKISVIVTTMYTNMLLVTEQLLQTLFW